MWGHCMKACFCSVFLVRGRCSCLPWNISRPGQCTEVFGEWKEEGVWTVPSAVWMTILDWDWYSFYSPISPIPHHNKGTSIREAFGKLLPVLSTCGNRRHKTWRCNCLSFMFLCPSKSKCHVTYEENECELELVKQCCLKWGLVFCIFYFVLRKKSGYCHISPVACHLCC